MKHTPGPWNYQEESDVYTHIVRDSTGDRIIGQTMQRSDRVYEANARLMAASPELLGICQTLSEAFARQDGQTAYFIGDQAIGVLNRVIAKAINH